MKKITIKDAAALFPEILSPCCSAIIHMSTCCNCGKTTVMPFYFIADQPIPDEVAIEKEQQLRSKLPVGACIAAWLNLPPADNMENYATNGNNGS